MRLAALATACGLACAMPAHAAKPPPALRGIGVTEHRGAQVPLDVPLVDHRGRHVTLGHYFDGTHPVLLVLAYYRCPMLCTLVPDGVASAARGAGRRLGADWNAVTGSIHPKDSPATAATKRRTVLQPFATPPADDAWPFLTGTAAEVRRIADAVGFAYRYDPRSGQYAHPAVEMLLTPDGRVSRYLYGFDPQPAELDAGLATAADGDTGRSVQHLLLQCFRYAPSLRRYAGSVYLFLRLGAVAILLAVGAVVWIGWRRARGAEGAP